MKNNALTWPESLALACPQCNEGYPLSGVRPDGGLLFHCDTHKWFAADSWTSGTAPVNTHVVEDRTADPAIRREFIANAIGLLIRAGATLDNVVLQSAVPDNSMQFVVIGAGDGTVSAGASSRRHPCERCATRPLAPAQEQVLFDLGFDPIKANEQYYADGLPASVDELTAVSELVFRDAFEEAPGMSLWAIFSQPALAEAFYLGWSFAPWR